MFLIDCTISHSCTKNIMWEENEVYVLDNYTNRDQKI